MRSASAATACGVARHLGVTFDERYFSDWCQCLAVQMAVERGLAQRFVGLGLGHPDPPARVRLGFDDTLNIALLFGAPWAVRDGISWMQPGFLATPEAVKSLTPPDLTTAWPNTLMLAQFTEASAALGRGNVIPPRPHGVLETALDLRGEQFLVDLYQDPALAEAFLHLLADTVIRQHAFWLAQREGVGCLRPAQREWEDIPLGGCSATMLSPRLFERFILPQYQRISTAFGGGFLCACGRCSHLLSAFAGLEHCRYFRLGWGTDIAQARRVLGPRHIKASLDAAGFAYQDTSAVRRTVLQLVEQGQAGPLSILLVHAGAETPDANIYTLWETVVACGGRVATAPKAP